jgi:glycosyltransferase involved in cell wall biosynthesis
MKILIDATTTQDQYATRGIGRVTRELVTALVERSARLRNDDQYHLLLFNAPTTLNPLVQRYPSRVRTVNIGKVRLAGKFDFIWWRLQFAPAIRRELKTEKPDLYLCPNSLRGFPVRGIPVVSIVYDFAFIRLGRYSLAPKGLDWIRRLQYQHALKQLRHAAGIATISENTRKDLMEFVPRLTRPIVKTIYLGLSPEFKCTKPRPKILAKYLPNRIIDQGYILYYGGLEVNKNVPAVVESYIELRRMWEKKFGNTLICPYLVLAGGDFTRLDVRNPVLAEIRDIITRHNLEDEVCFTGYYEDEHASDLINAARLFVHISLYEGFGFSPLEAMKCGVPVVASNRSCYPEILGDGALLVNPERPHDVARACLHILTDKTLSAHLTDAGKMKAAAYSWDSTAKHMTTLFDEVVSRRK